jgi:hypothetical protein
MQERLRVGSLELDVDGKVLEQDERWRETVVDLFATAAEQLGAVSPRPSWRRAGSRPRTTA